VLISGPNGFDTTGSGTIQVGSNMTIPVSITMGRTVTLTFHEKGLVKAQQWCLSVDGYGQCATTSSVGFLDLTPGAYAYAVVSPLVGQNITQKVGLTTTYGPAGTITLAKSSVVNLGFAYRYSVTLTETGLSTGSWSITIKGHTETALWNQTIQFNLTNGTYGYKVGAETGYKSLKSPSKVAVNGSSVSAVVTFVKKS
jgi:hypothetical protein